MWYKCKLLGSIEGGEWIGFLWVHCGHLWSISLSGGDSFADEMLMELVNSMTVPTQHLKCLNCMYSSGVLRKFF